MNPRVPQEDSTLFRSSQLRLSRLKCPQDTCLSLSLPAIQHGKVSHPQCHRSASRRILSDWLTRHCLFHRMFRYYRCSCSDPTLALWGLLAWKRDFAHSNPLLYHSIVDGILVFCPSIRMTNRRRWSRRMAFAPSLLLSEWRHQCQAEYTVSTELKIE